MCSERPSPLKWKCTTGTFKLKSQKLNAKVGFYLYQEGTTVCIRLSQGSMTPKKLPGHPESPLSPFWGVGPTECKGSADPDSKHPHSSAHRHMKAWTWLPPIPQDFSEPTMSSQTNPCSAIPGFFQAPETQREQVDQTRWWPPPPWA